MRTGLQISVAVAAWVSAAFGAAPEKLELRGKVDYGAARYRFLQITIHKVESPFTATTLSGPGGEFRFRELAPGGYTVAVIRRGLGEVRRTVVLSHALADKKGVVRTTIAFSPSEAALGGGAGKVSRNSLTVPRRAVEKYIEAERHLGRSDAKRARKSLEDAVKIAPHYTAAWNYLGVLSYQERDLERAEILFRHALDIEPQAFEPIVNLGGILLALGRPKDALPLNQKAVQLRPKDSLALGQLGVSYFALGQMEEAKPHLEEVKLADPSHFTQPQLYLSRIYERQGERALAAREIEDLLARRPDGPQVESLKRRLRRLQAP